MSNLHTKKVLKKYFDEILRGEKTYEIRLANWQCEQGDTLELIELDDETKQPTGRTMKRRVGTVGRTKDLDFWPEEDTQEYGYQIIALVDEEPRSAGGMNTTMRKFGYPDTLVKEYEHWVILLKPQQTTIGTLVLVEKSDAEHLGELSEDSWAEFKTVSHDAEQWTRRAFGAEKFNYLALMMKDPNVHFHFVPRYSQPVVIGGKLYTDTDWPSKTELGKLELDNNKMQEILSKMRSAQ